jgi:hypothetical protein
MAVSSLWSGARRCNLPDAGKPLVDFRAIGKHARGVQIVAPCPPEAGFVENVPAEDEGCD